jgi:hypothetical protein
MRLLRFKEKYIGGSGFPAAIFSGGLAEQSRLESRSHEILSNFLSNEKCLE